MTKPSVAIGLAALLSACSFVEPLPGSQRIILAEPSDTCTEVKQVELTVLDTAALIERRPQAIDEELTVLAKNEALSANANAIWPISEREGGIQTFALLRCQPN